MLAQMFIMNIFNFLFCLWKLQISKVILIGTKINKYILGSKLLFMEEDTSCQILIMWFNFFFPKEAYSIKAKILSFSSMCFHLQRHNSLDKGRWI